jgi:ATP-dependent DNA helicase RecQ
MSKEKREMAQGQWMGNSAPVMVATTAFGMGIDKPDVRTVIHYDAPEHLEAYYQEAGRAGRDNKPSNALALYNNADITRLHDSIALQYPPQAYLRQVYQAVVEYLQIPISAQPDRYFPFDLHGFCKRFSLKATEAIHALKLLEQEGLWTMTEAVYNPATVQFTADRNVLDNLSVAHPTLSYVTIGLLRMYNTIFHFPTAIREMAIARQLKMKLDEVVHSLELLGKMQILEYNKPGEGPQLFFHHYRVDSRHLIIDVNRINILRKRHEERTNAMIRFLKNTTACREQILLNYFGEKSEKDCGHCDVCQSKQTISITDKQLQHELLALVKQHNQMAIQDFKAAYPMPLHDKIAHLLRRMVDDELLVLKNGILSLNT